MPAVSIRQRRAMAIAEHHPEELNAKNRGLLSLSHEQLHDFADTPESGLPRSKEPMAEDKKKKNFIAGAIKHPGSLRAAAKRNGRSTRQEADVEKHSSNKKIRSRGNLAITLMGMNH